jgi:hypothetical protein
LPQVISVRAGIAFTCALTVDDGTWCWGLGVDGQLGMGARTSSAVPVAVAAGIVSLRSMPEPHMPVEHGIGRGLGLGRTAVGSWAMAHA